jgi:hypothetical protein
VHIMREVLSTVLSSSFTEYLLEQMNTSIAKQKGVHPSVPGKIFVTQMDAYVEDYKKRTTMRYCIFISLLRYFVATLFC